MEMDIDLHYTDESDKSLGIAGMAIALVACDSESILASVSLEPDEEAFDFTQDFFFSGNPRQSARIAWNELLRQFQIASSLLLGNVFCRARAAGRAPEAAALDMVRAFIDGEGREYCSLEADEIQAVYDKNLRFHTRLFTHPGVLSVARDFATVLRMRRTMSAGEVFEQLARLNSI